MCHKKNEGTEKGRKGEREREGGRERERERERDSKGVIQLGQTMDVDMKHSRSVG